MPDASHPGVPVNVHPPTLAFALGGSIGAWALHFLGSYVVVACTCSRQWGAGRYLLGGMTVTLAAVALGAGIVGYREWRRVDQQPLWDVLTAPQGWYPFLMTASVLLAGVAALAIVMAGSSAMALPLCGGGTALP